MDGSLPNLENAVSKKPEVFFAKHMQPGTCGYDSETVLVDTEAMKAMIKTGVGIPIYVHHQNVDYSTMKEKAVGYVTESFYNEADGWAWFKCLMVDDEGFNAVAKGWHVSNAYVPTEWGPAGTKNNVPYDREVLNGTFTHLAIVPDPRYEDAVIVSPSDFSAYQDLKKRELHNSKTEPAKGTQMFKLFKNKKEEVTQIDGDTIVELEGGKEVTVAEMLNALTSAKKADDEKTNAKPVDGDALVECNGEKIPVKELVSRFEKLNAKSKKNEDDKKEEDDCKMNEDDEDKEKDEKKNKKNDGEEDEDEEGKEKKNDRNHFEELRNAHLIEAAPSVIIDTPMAQVKRGQERYGKQA